MRWWWIIEIYSAFIFLWNFKPVFFDVNWHVIMLQKSLKPTIIESECNSLHISCKCLYHVKPDNNFVLLQYSCKHSKTSTIHILFMPKFFLDALHFSARNIILENNFGFKQFYECTLLAKGSNNTVTQISTYTINNSQHHLNVCLQLHHKIITLKRAV